MLRGRAMHLIFEITHKCPAKCPQCKVRKNPITVDVHTFSRVLTIFKNVPSSRYLLTVSGGEPSVLENLREYVCTGRKLGYSVTVVTNGYNPKRVMEAKPNAVQVSVDYFGEKHDRHRGLKLWDGVLELLYGIKDRKITGFVRMTLMNDNIEDVRKMHEFLREEEIPAKIFGMPVKGVPKKKPSPEQLREAAKYCILPTGCPVGRGQFVVTPDLQVLDCLFTRNYIGSLNPLDQHSFEELLRRYEKLEPYPCGDRYEVQAVRC